MNTAWKSEPVPDDLRLRPVAPDDAHFLRVLYRTTREPEFIHTSWCEAQKAAFCDMQYDAQAAGFGHAWPHAKHLVICFAGLAVGRLVKGLTADGLRLVDIALLPQLRNRGLGTAILRQLQEEAATRGLPLELAVVKSSRALGLCRRLGLAVTGELGAHYALRWHAAATHPVA